MKRLLLPLLLLLFVNATTAQYNWSGGGWFAPAKAIDFAMAPNGNLYAACHVDNNYKALLLRSTDNGNTWTDITDVSYPADEYPHSIACVGNNILLAGMSVSISTDGGTVFSPAHSGLPFSFEPADLLVMPNGEVFFSGSELNGPKYEPRLYKSTNGGTNWSAVPLNGIASTLEVPRDLIHVNGKLVMAVEAWAVGGGSIYTSSDGGQNWTVASINAPDPTQFYRAVTFARGPGNELYLVGDHLAPATLPLFVSTNDGQSWSPLSHNGLTDFFATGGFIKSNGPFLLGGQLSGASQFVYEVYRSNNTVGLSEPGIGSRPVLYPNPAGDRLMLKAQDLAGASVKLVNALGMALPLNYSADGVIDVSGIEAGVYLLQVEEKFQAPVIISH
jgi:hypothetical protein